MRTTRLLAALCLSAVAVPTVATARPVPAAVMVDGNTVLAEVDRRAASFKDQSYDATMKIVKNGELKKTLEFTAVMKGLDKQLLEFHTPGDITGMKVLMTGDSLYVFLPQFNKVRRVATHVQEQSFMGGEMNYRDMKETQLSPYYNAEIGGREGSETTLILTPKEGVDAQFARLECVIDGTKGGVTRIRYYDSKGTQVREQQRSEWIKVGDISMPTMVVMLNYKTGDSTGVYLRNVQVNQGVDDSLFSRHTLLRG